MSNLSFAVEGHSLSPTQFKANARGFTILVDEPEALGGVDAAPNPVEYLLASHAGCLNVVLHLVAQQLGIALQRVQIHISGELNPERFLGQSYGQRAGFLGLVVQVHITSDATALQLDELLAQTEQRCPINDNLQHTTPVRYQLHRHPAKQAA